MVENRRTKELFMFIVVLFIGLSPGILVASESLGVRPNIVVILADDLGYSDIGAFGSEMKTPNIDALANEGLQLINFHTGASCGPTRSMLMSGTDNHIAGAGINAAGLFRLTWLRGRPGYEGYLNKRVVAFPKLLQDTGYHTYMAGKWDLGGKPGFLPIDRGFERSFALIEAGGSHFNDAIGMFSAAPNLNYYEDGNKIKQLPEDFYSSNFYTDKIVEYIDSNKGSDNPFFAYLSFTAVHWPLQAPDDWIDRNKGRYDKGWDVLRRERLSRLKSMKLVPKDSQLPPRLHNVPAWEELSETARKVEARKMEVYSAMVENMDYNIGRLIQHLKDTGQYDNTFILFFSDNGAEGNNIGGILDNNYWLPANFDNRLDNIGRVGSYQWMGAGWAQVSVTPKRMYKSFSTEGGIHTPAIISKPGMRLAKRRSNQLVTVMDVAPTLLELAGTHHPGSSYEGREVVPMIGKSMLPYLQGRANRVHAVDEALGWELYGSRAIRKGDWKIVWVWPPYGLGRWELFDLSEDFSEANDLSEERPEKLAELIKHWDEYVEKTDLVVFDRDTGYGRQ